MLTFLKIFFVILCVLGMLPIFLIVVTWIISIPSSIKEEPRFSEIYNQTFVTQEELFILKWSDTGKLFLDTSPSGWSETIAPDEKGTHLKVNDIVQQHSWAATSLIVRVDLEDVRFSKYRSIDASQLLLNGSAYSDDLAQFKPELLRNVEIKNLQTAVLYKDVKAIAELLKKGADMNQADLEGKTPLHYAWELDMVQYLLENGADCRLLDRSGRSLLHYAAKEGRLDIIELLVKNGAALDTQDKKMDTPVLIAANARDLDSVIFLLKSGADPLIKGEYQDTVLLSAAQNGWLDIVELTLQLGADPNDIVHSMSGLHIATRDGNFAMAKRFIEAGGDVNAVNSSGVTPLHYAANDLEMLQLLINNGADIQSVNDKGETVLHKAAYSSNDVDVFQYLYEKGAHMNQRDSDGDTPLHVAIKARAENINIVRWLINHSADIDLANNKGITPLQTAKLYKRADVINLIKNAMNKSKSEKNVGCSNPNSAGLRWKNTP